MSDESHGGAVILITFLIALLLNILPMPDWLDPLRPQWAVLTLIYWCLALPQRVGVLIGWSAGLGLDILTGTLIGQHALGMSLVAYVTLKAHQRIRAFPILQQSFIVFFLLLAEQLTSFVVMGAIHLPPPPLSYWLPPIAGTLLWPWLSGLLRGVRQHYHVV